MPNHLPFRFRDKRQRESSGGAEGIDDKMLGLPADRQGLECRYGHLSDCFPIGVGLASDNNLWIHALQSARYLSAYYRPIPFFIKSKDATSAEQIKTCLLI